MLGFVSCIPLLDVLAHPTSQARTLVQPARGDATPLVRQARRLCGCCLLTVKPVQQPNRIWARLAGALLWTNLTEFSRALDSRGRRSNWLGPFRPVTPRKRTGNPMWLHHLRARLTLAISCEGRNRGFAMTGRPWPTHASNRPSSAASRCWMAPPIPRRMWPPWPVGWTALLPTRW
jgi:hypothetical protein